MKYILPPPVLWWNESGAGILSSLCFGVAFFLATAMPEGPAPDPLAIGHGTTLAVALAIIAAYYLATPGVGTPTHTVAPAKGSWSQSPKTGSSAIRCMAGAAACLAAVSGNGTRSPDLPVYGGETKANGPSTATCSAAVPEGVTGSLISIIPTGTSTPITEDNSLFPWPCTKGILRTCMQYPAFPAGPKSHIVGC